MAKAGAFRWWELKQSLNLAIDDWDFMCFLDRLVELRELKRLEMPDTVSQYRVYTKMGV